MFQKANDIKSNLILTLLSWVDFLGPSYCIFENVRGFLSYNLNAIQLDEHRTSGGVSMGGLKFLVHAMLAMKYVVLPVLGLHHCFQDLSVYVSHHVRCSYQVRFCLLQAAHYGTPQTRVRFFLFGARRRYPLPAAPKPTHDFPPTHKLDIRFPNGDVARAVRAEAGIASFKFVTIDDAISDLPRFDWCESSHSYMPPPASLSQMFSDEDKKTYSRRNPSLSRLPANKQEEARQRAVKVRVLECDQEKPHVGFTGATPYHHAPRTTFQALCRKGHTQDLQHFTRTLKPETVERYAHSYSLRASDARALIDLALCARISGL